MSESSLNLVSTVVAQAISALIIAILLRKFFIDYGKGYLRYWSLSWLGLGIYLGVGIVALLLGRSLPATHPTRVALSLTAGVAAYLEILFLIFGSYELSVKRPVRLATARRWIPVFVAIGLLTPLFFIQDPRAGAERLFVRIGIRCFFTGLAFVVSAILVARSRPQKRGVGLTLLCVTFSLYGLEMFHYFAIAWMRLQGQSFDYVVYLGFIDLVLQALIGLGMITCLLEEEREAAILASNEIEHLAYHDALTGLPNRPMFIDRLILALAHAQRHKHKLAVFFVDLDRFKEINDSLGHSVGDSLLKGVAERISRSVRAEDTVARFAGDEFTLLAPKIDNVEDAAKIAQKVIEALKIPFQIGDRELFITTSIGIAFFPTDGLDVETLVKNADTAMYRAKDYGRDNYQIYAPAMNAQALERLSLENMLRRALSQDELVLHYQPLIDVKSGKISGAEALLRWNHPELGLLYPAHFISTAEVSGLILPIGDWVLRQACRQGKAWQKRIHGEFSMAVNLSARQFQQPDLVGMIKETLAETQLDPGSLVLEITESNAMQNAENTIHTLLELKRIGVRISMDDFGTGYSSLNYLKRFPIDTLKLDQSFVRGIATDRGDGAIATAVITMAHSLSLTVVAEGVETEGQLAFLTDRSCDSIQGFFFSAARDSEDFESFVKANEHLT